LYKTWHAHWWRESFSRKAKGFVVEPSRINAKVRVTERIILIRENLLIWGFPFVPIKFLGIRP
jgi:hypothetical protein